MQSLRNFCSAAMACALTCGAHAADAVLLPKDRRASAPVTLNTLRSFPEVASKAAWERRAADIREQVLVSCGLWPMPEKTPLNAKIFGRIERDGYSVEKVYFQSYPGFYVAGNLYRPMGKKGPFPGILNPHGHWAKGRLEDVKDGSAVARCINFAKQGMVALSWDMIGYNDTQFATAPGEPGYRTHRHFANDPTNQLWHISQMGLQTWNSVRALDFLASLPDVDPKRLACTGESGGGTQTFMLGAIDDRMAAQAPIVMVSHSMQGGCSCENVAGLRVDYSNMEISAAAAPRPQLLVAATGDWTKSILTVEGPAVASVYKLLGAEDRMKFVRFDFNHNYNQTSREAVYAWFGRWLLHAPDPDALKEVPYTKEPDADLRVFPDGKLPPDAATEEQLTAHLIRSATNDLWSHKPTNPVLLAQYRKEMLPAWRRSLQIDSTERRLLVEPGKITKLPDCTITILAIGRDGRGDRIPAVLITPRHDPLRTMAILVHPDGKSAYLDESGAPKGLARQLIEKETAVLLLDTFLTGELADETAAKARNYFTNFFTGYNRTDVQERVQDIVTACSFAQAHSKGRRVILCGSGRAGLWTLLAAPAADAVVADCAQLDSANDRELLARDLFAPGLRKLGAFEGTAAIAATNPLLVHNTGEKFTTTFLSDVYARNRVPEKFRQETAALDEAAVADWIAELRFR
ncbi:MAG TPA: acetylxylan esterase [Candidatus Acidoferrum sp.]|nr:acetylxylan esterase [Candidatus Acidoferrum sp.]